MPKNNKYNYFKFDFNEFYLANPEINKNIVMQMQQYKNNSEEKDDFIDALKYFYEGRKINAKKKGSDKNKEKSQKN